MILEPDFQELGGELIRIGTLLRMGNYRALPDELRLTRGISLLFVALHPSYIRQSLQDSSGEITVILPSVRTPPTSPH